MRATIALSLDLKGLECPLPVVRTARAMKGLSPGRLVEVLATDPGSAPDFIAWSRMTGNPIVDARVRDGVYRFVLRKKETPP